MTKAELQTALNSLDHVAGPITTVVAVLRDVIAQVIHGEDAEPEALAAPQAAEPAPEGADPFATPEPVGVEQTEDEIVPPEAPPDDENEPSTSRRGRRS